MNKSLKVKRMTGMAIFVVLVVVLQLFSNYVTFGPVSITLALIPIVVGGILYGPLCGLTLGIICGILVFFAPSTMAIFWPLGVFETLIVCVLKMAVAGFISAYIYKLLHNKNKKLSVTLASISMPIVNTGLFALSTLTIFSDFLNGLASEAGQNAIIYLFLSFIGFNFLIEFAVNSILSPVVLRLTNIAAENFDLGIK